MMRRFAYMIAGLLLATALAWGGLYAVGYISEQLHGPDSLFDSDRDAMNSFLVLWYVLSAIGIVGGFWLGGRSSDKSP